MAMPKVKLGNAPKHFKKPVDVVLLSGDVAAIELSFIYRTRKQFAELLDEKLAEDKAEHDAALATEGDVALAPAPVKTVVEWYAEADAAGAKFVLKIANGWDLDDPFTEESLLRLEDENPGALAAIAQKYRQSVAEVRVKNS
ncbi:hypothetical protein GTP46_24445 [Duganella sp. FT135W]|uniref:Tail assembly chaperone n=1 Tax=Duganella flavida TaxID=2692175 RepID=A0A6L8KJ61_9BURK|nr:phage tail assembly chaperone [Duganella flavida]MYM25782.1 hypothetical protein [Duganella flavida]